MVSACYPVLIYIGGAKLAAGLGPKYYTRCWYKSLINVNPRARFKRGEVQRDADRRRIDESRRLGTFTVTQLDSFIAVRRMINTVIIRWRQFVAEDFHGTRNNARGYASRLPPLVRDRLASLIKPISKSNTRTPVSKLDTYHLIKP